MSIQLLASAEDNGVGKDSVESGLDANAVASESRDTKIQAEKTAEDKAEQEKEIFYVRLNDILAPASDGLDPEISTTHLRKLVKLELRLTEILTDYDNFPLQRFERDALTELRKETESNIVETKAKIEEAKQLACAHTLAAYDAVRLYTEESQPVGGALKTLACTSTQKILTLSNFCLKGKEKSRSPRQRKRRKFSELPRERVLL